MPGLDGDETQVKHLSSTLKAQTLIPTTSKTKKVTPSHTFLKWAVSWCTWAVQLSVAVPGLWSRRHAQVRHGSSTCIALWGLQRACQQLNRISRTSGQKQSRQMTPVLCKKVCLHLAHSRGGFLVVVVIFQVIVVTAWGSMPNWFESKMPWI